MTNFFGRFGFGVTAIAAMAGTMKSAFAEGQPVDWQIGFQKAASPVMEEITWMHNSLLMPIITVITIFVACLLLWVMIRYRKGANPNPSKTTHNTLIEVAWTVIPILILVVIAIPSFRLLYFQREFPPADMTIKAIGNQWYWTYEYPDNGNFTFDSLMVEDADLQEGQPRLLAVDNEIVVPVGKNIRVIVTATDVIHNWAMPAFGVKMDGVPGRLNETWFNAQREGVYYGQCSELCGVRHAFMPIAVRVVSEDDFAAWLSEAQAKFASADPDAKDQRQIAQAGAE